MISSLGQTAPLNFAQNVAPAREQVETREAFQQFVAGTFFREMLGALRRGTDEVAYLSGGQAEKMFREQMDGQIADQLARSHGDVIAQPLYRRFRSGLDVSV